ncbi:MAG: PQQ-binding-like beta-propeller repeat protein [Gammaproteobacteria bacterium]|jgi:quinoprotein glucose dehydrogenase
MSRWLIVIVTACAAAACSGPADQGTTTDGAPSATQAGSAPAAGADAMTVAATPDRGGMTQWRHYGGNLEAHRYSPLAQINADNVADLRVAWRWQGSNFGPRPEQKNEATPLMIDGVLYTTAGITRNVVAIDPESGETLWIWRPQEDAERFERAPRKSSGRGLSYWTDGAGNDRLIVVTPGFQLAALDPATGRAIPGFGENGIVDMLPGVRGEYTDHATIGNTSPALIIGDIVVVGPAHAPGSRPPSKQNVKGDVRAYDVRTGQELWSFHTIPNPGEPGYETWLEGSAEFTGNAGVWGRISADVERGLVYLPVEAPTSDWYGGERPGNNLYGNSLVCVDARTGEIVWYYQFIHHDIWDWDNPTAPILMDIEVDGVAIPAVAQVTKQAWVYTFNRITGEPVWPIEERPVPAGDVPGEWYSPTQPFPTKPAAFDRQGFTEDDVIDFTPALRAEALEGLQAVRMGPMFTPPSLANADDGTSGTLSLPSAVGGANWEAATFDPETGMLYVGSFTNPNVLALEPPNDGADIRYVRGGGAELPWLSGLPVVKPPYGRITAIDMNTGEHAWMRPNSPTPDDILNNPALEGVAIPETGRGTRAMLLATKTLLFGTDGWGGTPFLRAYDKATGELIAEIAIPGASSGLPMSYAINGRQYIALPVAGERGAELVALALPE